MSDYSSTSNPNMGNYEGRIGLSPLATYPSTMGNEANDGDFSLRHHIYAIGHYSSVGQELPFLSGVLY